jgi:hypothetical protein
MLRTILLVLAAAHLAIGAAAAQERKPRLPPGLDPGGVAVALVATGIDYTLPAIAARLARDGEGQMIGWDLVENDNLPFDRSKGGAPAGWGGDATAIASLMLAGTGGIRLVPVRVDPAVPVTLARAVAFIAQTPARIAVLAPWSTRREDWEPFRQATSHFRDVLFIVPAGDGEPAFPAALGLETVLVVAGGAPGTEAAGFGGAMQRVPAGAMAAAAASKAAAALLVREARLSAADLRRRLMESEGGPQWRPHR